MQNLTEGDQVTLTTDSFETNGKIGKIVEVSRGTTGVRVLLEDGNTVIVSMNEVTKQSFLSE